MRALVLGATGAVGRDLLDLLLADGAFDRVDIFVRRPVAVESPKLHTHVVVFDEMEKWKDLLAGDVLFSCLGTTLRAAGGQEAQWKVDYTYQYEAAKAARENGVPRYVLVSSIGASSKSKVFYTKMKGALEEAVKDLGFRSCAIVRPPSLIRKDSDRFGEKFGVVALKALNAIGLLRAWRPMPTETVADAMVRLAKESPAGNVTLDAKELELVKTER